MSCGYNSGITLNGKGTFAIPPQWVAYWPPGGAPKQAVYCVASGSATLLQIVIWY